MSTRPSLSIALLSLLLLSACDEAKQAEPEPEPSLQANAVTVAAADLELAAIVELVEREDVRDAESLETLLNTEDSSIRVDVDADGTRDFIAVHEVGDAQAEVDAKVELEAEADGAIAITGDEGQQVHFELRAIPSSKITVEAEAEPAILEAQTESVVVATVDVELHVEKREVVVVASYAPTVTVVSDVEIEHSYTHHVTLEHRHEHLVVVGAPFIAWVWFDARPIYVGHVHLPPGHAKKLGLHWHHHGHGHHGHHGGPKKVHVKAHGGHHGVHGPDKIHVKTKGGGGGKVHVKTHGGGKIHVKTKSRKGGKGGKGGKGKH